MAFLKGLLRKIKGPDEVKKKSSLDKVRRDIDPDEVWEVIGELGDGAYGKVYKAKQRKGETLTALKKVEFDSEVALEDFMVEIDILTEFKHPNIISLLEVYIYDSKLWMFLELCDGGALDSIMTTLEKPLNERQIRFVAREVLAGLKFLHENLIIHRDMKAGNILLTSANEVKLADFGVSAFLANEKQKRDTFIGSPYWMAPEVIACEALKESPYNWKADVWSFGITLIELAQMRPPYNDINPTRVLLKITKSDPPTLAKPRFWSNEFSDLLSRCLQKDPNKRAECSELLSDPFVANLSEKDRECIKLLMCELKADVIDTVEESDSVELDDEEEHAEENVLILPDSTKIEVPMEVVDEDEENYDSETKAKEELLDLDRATEDQPFEVVPQKPDEPKPLDSNPVTQNSVVEFASFPVLVLDSKRSEPAEHNSTYLLQVVRSTSVRLPEKPPQHSPLKRRATVLGGPSPFRSGSLFAFLATSSQNKLNTAGKAFTPTRSVAHSGSFSLPPTVIHIKSQHSSHLGSQTPSPVLDPEPAHEYRTELTLPYYPPSIRRKPHSCKPVPENTQVARVNLGPDLLFRSLLRDLAQDLTDQLISEVVTSETRHPSVPSCLFEVMRDISEEVDVRQTIPEEDRLPSQPIAPKPPASGPKLSRRASAHKSLTRTRRFVVDGKVVTTTTKHIIPANAEVLKQREEDLNSRKAELRAFRMLGKQEARQTRELTAKAIQQKEQLETKLATEFLALKRGYEQKLELVSRNYRAQLERLEKEYETDSKRIRSTTVKEGQTFKEQLRKELDKCSRAERKIAMRELNSDNSMFPGGSMSLSASLTSLNSLHSNSSQKSVISQQLLSFREQQGVRFTSHMKQLTLAFQERLYHLREEELVEKHTIRMNFEQEKWKMEQRHMHMRHQLSRSKLQDFFSIKRQKLAGLLELELYELRQTITREREKLNTIHAIERKNHAKYVKNMQKKNMTDFHRHCRLDSSLTTSRLKERLREDKYRPKSVYSSIQSSSNHLGDMCKRSSCSPFEEATRKQLGDETYEFEQKLQRQQELLEYSIVVRLKELEQSHSDKRNDLTDLETERLRELDEKHEYELRSYIESFTHTQALLRAQFQEELGQVSSQPSSRADPSRIKRPISSRYSMSSSSNSSNFASSGLSIPGTSMNPSSPRFHRDK
ncbi:hypothetical protein CRM22_007252 [Opisthorchis felineus]|uniref:Protein kinase domain-containing protein n=1 Tax=Opisthorchis felineus TaxID=147828 RepID=A0A4S2LPJ3_OPIFE|nr:hypothetical protein CRM22_007252 [Opisthorchis felineus]